MRKNDFNTWKKQKKIKDRLELHLTKQPNRKNFWTQPVNKTPLEIFPIKNNDIYLQAFFLVNKINSVKIFIVKFEKLNNNFFKWIS